MKNVQKELINFANFACKSAVLRANYTRNTGAKHACKKYTQKYTRNYTQFFRNWV